MPLTEKGEEVKKAMEKEYGEKKGEQAFYASENKGQITGLAAKDSPDYFQALPETITLAEINKKNKELWTQKTAEEAPKNF